MRKSNKLLRHGKAAVEEMPSNPPSPIEKLVDDAFANKLTRSAFRTEAQALVSTLVAAEILKRMFTKMEIITTRINSLQKSLRDTASMTCLDTLLSINEEVDKSKLVSLWRLQVTVEDELIAIVKEQRDEVGRAMILLLLL